jgi:hypothetical protein
MAHDRFNPLYRNALQDNAAINFPPLPEPVLKFTGGKNTRK